MSIRFVSLVALLVALCAAAAAPAGAQGPTEVPAPGVTPGACTDLFAPTSSISARAVKSAKRTRIIRGTASDQGCGLNQVSISISRKVGRGCQNLISSSRFGHRSKCGRMSFLPVKGTSHWSFRLPRKLRKGTYLLRTKTVDFAGNTHTARAKRLVIR